MAVGDLALSEDIPIISGATTLAKDIDLAINETRDFVAQEVKSRRTVAAGKYDKPSDGAALVRNEPGSAHIVGLYTTANADLFYRPDPSTATFDRQVATWKEFLPVYQGKLSPDVYGRQIGGNRRAVVVQDNGELGYAASSERYKKFVRPEDVTDEQVMMLSLVSYQWRAAVAVDDRREMGLIAERVVEAGLSWAAFFNEDGTVEGLNYEMVALAMLPAVQRLIARTHRIEDRLEALEAPQSTPKDPS